MPIVMEAYRSGDGKYLAPRARRRGGHRPCHRFRRLVRLRGVAGPGWLRLPPPLVEGGPTAAFTGSLEIRNRCVVTAGSQQFTVVWPPGYRLTIEDGEPVVLGDSAEIRMGEDVFMGGGYYETGEPPPGAFNIGGCSSPYFLTTGLVSN